MKFKSSTGKIIILLHLLVVLVFPVFAADSLLSPKDFRVAIVPFWLAGDNIPKAQITQKTIRQILRGTIPLAGNYRIDETINYPKTTAAVASFAATQRFDIVIYGSISTNTTRELYTIAFFAYSKEQKRTITQRKKSIPIGPGEKENIELLTIDFLEGFLQKQLRFGSVSFENLGKGEFIVFANGKEIGKNITDIPLFPIGKHTFQIKKIQGFEKIPVYEKKVLITNGKKEHIVFESLEEYGKIKFLRRDSGGEATVLIDGKPFFSLPPTGECYLSPGIHLVEIVQYDYKKKKHIAFSEKLTILSNKIIIRKIKTPLWGYGIIFRPGDGEDYTVYIDEKIKGKNITKIDVLTRGFHKIKILQNVEDTEICVFEGSVEIGNTGDQTVAFPVYKTLFDARSDGIITKQPIFPEDKNTPRNSQPSNKYGNDPIIDLTLDIMTLKTGYLWIGLNMEMFRKMLMVGLLTGFSVLEEDFFLLAEGKIHFQPFPRWLISPYLGGSFMDIYDFEFEKNSMFAGPQIGLKWNTGGSVISAVYVEIVYYFNISELKSSGLTAGLGIGFF